MQNPRKALSFALDKYPEQVELVPVEELMTDSARKNAKRPAYITLAVPDDVVKGLKGGRGEQRDLVLLVRVPKEILERSESRIVLPGEVR